MKQKITWYYFLPLIPILGIPLTIKHKDKYSMLDHKGLSLFSAGWQFWSIITITKWILN